MNEVNKNAPNPNFNYNEKVFGRIESLLNKDHFADVYFKVGTSTSDTQTFPAHKLVICSGSEVFDVMFNGSLPETDKVIPVTDVEPESFFALLKFLYSDTVQITEENLVSVLYVARKYQVSRLEEYCTDFLKKTLCVKNVLAYIRTATFFGMEDEKIICLGYVDVNANELFESEEFRRLDLTTLCVLLKRDTLRIREIDLFNCVMRWAEEECKRRQLVVIAENQRSVLGPAAELIRYPTMSKRHFEEYVASSGFLSDVDELSVLKYFTYEKKPTIKFSQTFRAATCNEMFYVGRYLSVAVVGSCQRNYTFTNLKFSVNRAIYLAGCALFPLYDYRVYEVTVKVVEVDASVQLTKERIRTRQKSDLHRRMLAEFKEPIPIQSEKTYFVSVMIHMANAKIYCSGISPLENSPVSGINSAGVVFRFYGGLDAERGTEIPYLLYFI